jgi:hypothetical protein
VAVIVHNSKLNDLVVDLGRSLLQYVAETDAWTADAAASNRLKDWAAAQRNDVGKLVEFLLDRGWPVEFGTYPTNFTDLQFLSLAYFLPKLAASQQQLVAELDESIHTCVDDPEAVTVLRDVLDGERRIATDLQAQAAAGSNGAPATPKS